MTFVLEDGTGVTGSNSYVDSTFVKTFHADRGRVIAEGTGTIEDAAVRASDYIDKRFGRRSRGFKQSRDQGMEWPRLDAFDNDGYSLNLLPKQLMAAAAEYTWRALQLGVLSPDPTSPVPSESLSGTKGTDSGTGEIRRKLEKVGPLTEETEYETGSSAEASANNTVKSSLVSDRVIPEYPEADLWMEELLRSATSRRLGRA